MMRSMRSFETKGWCYHREWESENRALKLIVWANWVSHVHATECEFSAGVKDKCYFVISFWKNSTCISFLLFGQSSYSKHSHTYIYKHILEHIMSSIAHGIRQTYVLYSRINGRKYGLGSMVKFLYNIEHRHVENIIQLSWIDVLSIQTSFIRVYVYIIQLSWIDVHSTQTSFSGPALALCIIFCWAELTFSRHRPHSACLN